MDQKNISSTIGTLPHPNETIVWNECLMRSEMRVGRMRMGDAYRQGGKNIKNFLQQLTISPKTGFAFMAQFPKSSSFSFLLILLRP